MSGGSEDDDEGDVGEEDEDGDDEDGDEEEGEGEEEEEGGTPGAGRAEEGGAGGGEGGKVGGGLGPLVDDVIPVVKTNDPFEEANIIRKVSAAGSSTRGHAAQGGDLKHTNRLFSSLTHIPRVRLCKQCDGGYPSF